jgi:hypothetical protein
MRIALSFTLLCLLAGCNNREAEKAAFEKLDQSIIRAMCVPWGKERRRAIADLADAIRDYSSEDGPADGDLVGDLAMDVTPKVCVDAGFANPGPPIPRRASPPPPPGFKVKP